jgi:hypothetical protein
MGDDRDNCAHRAEKTAEEDTFTTVLGEIRWTAADAVHQGSSTFRPISTPPMNTIKLPGMTVPIKAIDNGALMSQIRCHPEYLRYPGNPSKGACQRDHASCAC